MHLEALLCGRLNDQSTAVSENSQDWSYDIFVRHAFFARDYFIENNIKTVSLSIPQGFYAYTLIWGAYLAGTTYCPINMGMPEERIVYYINQFSPDLFINEKVSPEIVSVKQLTTDTIFNSFSPDEIIQSKNLNIAPDSTAYVIFTSGSTGLPKGVMASRRALENFLLFSISEFKVKKNDRWGQFSNLGFDLSVCDIFTAIICHATLVPSITIAEKLLPGLSIKNKSISIWHSVPSVIDMMDKSGHLNGDTLSNVHMMIFAGEKLFPSQLKLLFDANPKLIIYNGYGPTECTIFTTFKKLTADNYLNFCDKTVSIGKALPNYTIFLKDVEDGLGEIIVTGVSVATGYLGVNHDSPESRFKFIEHEGEIKWSYSTGDYARCIDGDFYYVTRKDTQIKIKGNRIDLSEIDHCLRECGCTSCISVPVNDKIISFVICDSVTESEIRSFLKKKLPPYYLPSIIIYKENFPYNKSGKINVNELIANIN